MNIGLLYDQLGAEELGLLSAADRLNITIQAVNGKTMVFSRDFQSECDVYINRCKSVNRRLKLAELFDNLEVEILNSYSVERNCNDKTISTLLFNRRGIPTPNTVFIPYNSIQDEKGEVLFRKRELLDVASKIKEHLSFPLIVKPAMGSWGKQIRKVGDETALNLELKSNLPTMINHIGFYVQEFIPKAFDVRGYVAVLRGEYEYITALARVSPSDDKFVTNTAQGGMPIGIDVPSELKRLFIDVAETVNSKRETALLALDVMPIMDDKREREKIYDLYRQLKHHFTKTLHLRTKLYDGKHLTKEWVEASDIWLRKTFEEFINQETYQKLKNSVEDHLEQKSILSQEVNSNTDYWFSTRNVTNVNLADYYLKCAVTLGGD